MSHHHGLFCDVFGCSKEPTGSWDRPGSTSPRIVQLQPWRDLLLALTDQGEIYRVHSDEARGLTQAPTFYLWSRGVPPPKAGA